MCVYICRWKDGTELKGRIWNNKIRRKSQVKDMEKVKKAKWIWAGHLIRRKDDGWSKRATEWIPRYGKDPEKDTEIDGRTTLQNMWVASGQDWHRRRYHEEDFMQQWMNLAWWGEVGGGGTRWAIGFHVLHLVRTCIKKHLFRKYHTQT